MEQSVLLRERAGKLYTTLKTISSESLDDYQEEAINGVLNDTQNRIDYILNPVFEDNRTKIDSLEKTVRIFKKTRVLKTDFNDMSFFKRLFTLKLK